MNPRKKDWAKNNIENLQHLGLTYTMEDIGNMAKPTYKKLIKKKILEFSFKYLVEKRNARNGKGFDIQYEKLEEEKTIIF